MVQFNDLVILSYLLVIVLMNFYNLDMSYITIRYIFWYLIKGRKKKKWLPLTPGVSIQIPIYNEDPIMVRKLLDSIYEQDYPKDKIEVIIVDQSEIESIVTQLKVQVDSFRRKTNMSVKLLFKDRFGDGKTTNTQFVAGALNLATKHSTHEIVSIIAGDSYLHEDYLKKAVRHFQHDDIGFVCTRAIFVHYDFISRLLRLLYNSGFLFGIIKCSMKFPHFITGQCFARKKIVEENPWDTNCEDIYISLIARIKGWNVWCEKDSIAYNIGAAVSFKALKKTTKRQVFGQVKAFQLVLGNKKFRWTVLKDFQLVVHISPVVLLPLLLFLIPINLVLFSINIDQNLAFLVVTAVLLLTGAFLLVLTFIATIKLGVKSDFLYYPLVLASSFIFLVPTTVGILKSFVRKQEAFYRTQRGNEENPPMDLGIKLMEWLLLLVSVILTLFYLLTANLAGTGFFLVIAIVSLIGMSDVKITRKEGDKIIA